MRDEGGFTFPELSVAIIVMLIVGVAVLTFIVISARQYSNQEDRVTKTDQARNALLRITSELRDAGGVSYAGPGTVQAEVRQGDGSFRQVTYSCEGPAASASCTRTDVASGDAELLVEGVANDDPFRLVTGSDLTGTGSQGGAVEVTLALGLDDAQNPIVLRTSIRPRNCSDAEGVINPCG